MTDKDPYLNREYDARSTTQSFDRVTIYAERSAAARARIETLPDLVYDEKSGSKLDLHPAARGAPLFVWIHGGYWRSSSKNDNSFVAPGLVENGVAVANLDYTLAPAVQIGEIVRQIRSAIAWLHANAMRYGYSRDDIHVGGHSAGGHLTGMLLADGWPSQFGLPSDVIRSGFPVSGLFDLAPLQKTFVNDDLQFRDDEISANSPIRFIPKASNAALLAAVGGEESTEFRRQTENYAEAWKAAGHTGEYLLMPGFHHFDIILELEKPGNPLFDRLLATIKR